MTMKKPNKGDSGTAETNCKRSILKTFTLSATLVSIGVASVLLANRIQQSNIEKNDHELPLVLTNAPYCNGEKLDIVVPRGSSLSERPPLLVYIHGGGWRYGSKVGGAASYFYQLTKNNIAVASINYRLSSTTKFPEPVKDVVCAVKYLRANASMFGFDRENIFLAGQSSGANLALMAGLGSRNPIFEQKNYSDVSGDVRGVVALDAHYDLGYVDLAGETKVNIRDYLGAENDLLNSSPINFLNNDSPAMLIFHGINDKQIPVESAREFVQTAQVSGSQIQFIEVKNADHNLNSLFGRDKPNSDKRIEIIRDFIIINQSK